MKDINGKQLHIGSYVTAIVDNKKVHGIISGIPCSFADFDFGFESCEDIKDCVFVRFDEFSELYDSDPRGEPFCARELTLIC